MSESKSSDLTLWGIAEVLFTVLFVGLKLTHYITWSWWWVLSPLWIGLPIILIGTLIVFLIACVVAIFK